MSHIEELKSRFPKPKTIKFHNSIEGVAKCCRSAYITQLAAIKVAGSQHGLNGALSYIQSAFCWGVCSAEYFCEAIDKANNLDCSSASSVAICLLKEYLASAGNATVSIMPIQVVFKCSSHDVSLWTEMCRNCPSSNNGDWIVENYVYHECVGILLNKQNPSPPTLEVWDFGEYIVPPSNLNQVESVQCLKIAEKLDNLLIASWENVTVEIDQWTTFCPAVTVPTTPKHKDIYALITGCYGGPNPCSALGIANCLRASKTFTCASIALDYASHNFAGMGNIAFDGCEALLCLGYEMHSQYNLRYEGICQVMSTYIEQHGPNVFLLPGRDQDVVAIACAWNNLNTKQTSATGFLNKHLLTPLNYEFLMNMKKPDFRRLCEVEGFAGTCFIPASYTWSHETDLEKWILDTRYFTQGVGFPVLVKGSLGSAMLCYHWKEVQQQLSKLSTCNSSQDFYVQEWVSGVELTIAFAAYNGQYLGSVQMTKNTKTAEGKVWSGTLGPVNPSLDDLLRHFLATNQYTGGGELELIWVAERHQYAVIDFNFRFPAWIGALQHLNTSSNLVQLLINAALGQPEIFEPLESQHHFGRAIVEMPLEYVDIIRMQSCPVGRIGRTVLAAAKSFVCNEDRPLLMQRAEEDSPMPRTVVEMDNGNFLSDDFLFSKFDFEYDTTPIFAFSPRAFTRGIHNMQQYLCQLCEIGTESSVDGKYFIPCLSLSVKTQPHPVIMQIATSMFLHAECISVAEVIASLQRGFDASSILMTGGGKFWSGFNHQETYDMLNPYCETPSSKDIEEPTTPFKDPQQARALTWFKKHKNKQFLLLRAIYADSVIDMEYIIERIQDPDDWLACCVIGVRCAPAWDHASRFGIHMRKDIDSVVKLLKTVPKSIGFGIHFHCASSNIGTKEWFGMVNGVTVIASELCYQTDRQLQIMDVGGGWDLAVLTDTHTQSQWRTWIESLSQQDWLDNRFHLQLELGKSLTEHTGALISRVLEIRDDPLEECGASNRVAIVDAYTGQFSSLHQHPVLWIASPSNTDRGFSNNQPEKVPIVSGKDQIWGRTCMEHDVLYCNVQLPSQLQRGDLLVFLETGAYDCSMSYDFGDGQGRTMRLL